MIVKAPRQCRKRGSPGYLRISATLIDLAMNLSLHCPLPGNRAQPSPRKCANFTDQDFTSSSRDTATPPIWVSSPKPKVRPGPTPPAQAAASSTSATSAATTSPPPFASDVQVSHVRTMTSASRVSPKGWEICTMIRGRMRIR